MKVAKESGSELNFAISNKDDFLQEATEFGLTSIPEDKPRVHLFEKNWQILVSLLRSNKLLFHIKLVIKP